MLLTDLRGGCEQQLVSFLGQASDIDLRTTIGGCAPDRSPNGYCEQQPVSLPRPRYRCVLDYLRLCYGQTFEVVAANNSLSQFLGLATDMCQPEL